MPVMYLLSWGESQLSHMTLNGNPDVLSGIDCVGRGRPTRTNMTMIGVSSAVLLVESNGANEHVLLRIKNDRAPVFEQGSFYAGQSRRPAKEHTKETLPDLAVVSAPPAPLYPSVLSCQPGRARVLDCRSSCLQPCHRSVCLRDLNMHRSSYGLCVLQKCLPDTPSQHALYLRGCLSSRTNHSWHLSR